MSERTSESLTDKGSIIAEGSDRFPPGHIQLATVAVIPTVFPDHSSLVIESAFLIPSALFLLFLCRYFHLSHDTPSL
jgi:hypothetical protein